MTEFTPIVGARYRVRDAEGREALLFVNGPPFEDVFGTRYVNCQAEDLRDARGCSLKTKDAPGPVIIHALSWLLVQPPTHLAPEQPVKKV